MKIKDLSVCNEISEIYESRLILYGTGMWGMQIAECLDKMEKEVSAVCNTLEKTGKFLGHPVKSLQYIKENFDNEDSLLIIASLKHYKEMMAEYKKLDFKKAGICTLYAFFTSLWMHTDDSRIPAAFQNELKGNLYASSIRQKYNLGQYAFTMLVKAAEACKDTILIYQPGKVGSQSIWNSIRDKSVQFHSIMCPYGFSFFPKDLLDGYVERIKRKRLKIICGIREPIARDFSAFFQNSENMLWPFNSMNGNIFWSYGDFSGNGKTNKDYGDIPENRLDPVRWERSLEYTMLKLQKFIMQRKLDEFSWFDYEIKAVFQIDVFSYPFDKEAGYTIIRENAVEILLLKLERLPSLETVIAEFIGDKNYVLDSINRNADKIYCYTYQELKARVPVCSDYYAYYYGNDRMGHFYTQAEIAEFQEHWKEHIVYG